MTPTLPATAYWVADRLAAGPFPNPWAPALVDVGLSEFVDLTGLGARYEPLPRPARRTAFPIPDFSTPSAGQMVEILDHVDEHLADGVYVHCGAGIGRTGTVIGCWLIRHGLASATNWQQALDALRHPGAPRSPETDAQRRFVNGWEAGR